MVLGISQDVFERFLTAEDELVVSKGGGENPHPVLFKQPGMLERTAGRTVEDRNVNIEIAGSIECSNN